MTSSLSKTVGRRRGLGGGRRGGARRAQGRRIVPAWRGDQGLMLLAAYFVIAVLLVLGAAFLSGNLSDQHIAQHERNRTQALVAAEAGLERALLDLRADFVNDVDLTPASWTDGRIDTLPLQVSTTFYQTLPYEAQEQPTPIGGATYRVQVKGVPGRGDEIWLQSTGTASGTTRTLQTYVTVRDFGPWRNVIFAGAGAAGRLINGNVDIRGSVHALGDGLQPSEEAMDLLAVTLGGGAKIGNNYRDIPPAFGDRIPVLPTATVNGETVETLRAALRVKRGKVSLSGEATVGEPDERGEGPDGSAHKELVDGTYVTDGFAGNQATENVYSDNGFSVPYDLGDWVKFPSLADPYRDRATGRVHANYARYLGSIQFPCTVRPAGGPFKITPGAEFAYPAGDASSTYPNAIWMKPISKGGDGLLHIQGVVYVDGDVVFGRASSKSVEDEKDKDAWDARDTITYRGKGTLYVQGSSATAPAVTVHADLLTPPPNYDASTTTSSDSSTSSGLTSAGRAATFPAHVLGIVTPGEITFGTAHTQAMGAFYAEKRISSTKQTEVAGSFVSSLFEMGDQVPHIYQVPALADSLPPGMVGADPVWIVRPLGWVEL